MTPEEALDTIEGQIKAAQGHLYELYAQRRILKKPKPTRPSRDDLAAQAMALARQGWHTERIAAHCNVKPQSARTWLLYAADKEAEKLAGDYPEPEDDAHYYSDNHREAIEEWYNSVRQTKRAIMKTLPPMKARTNATSLADQTAQPAASAPSSASSASQPSAGRATRE